MATVSKKAVPAVDAVEEVATLDVAKAFEAAAAPARELQENVRKATEKTVEDTRAAYERVRAAADEATGSLEKSYAATAKGVVEFNTRIVDAVRANADANFDFAKSLFACNSVQEAVSLNSEHVRKQFEAMSFQAKELAQLAQKIANDAYEPIKATFARGFAVKL